MDSPLNLAHQQGRRADMMLKTGKFEEAIMCHNRAAEYLLVAMQQTRYKQALESLHLQHAHHLKQTSQLYDRQRRAQILQIKQTKSQLCHQATQTNIQGPVIACSVDQLNTFQSPRLDNNLPDPTTNTEHNTQVDEDTVYRTLNEQDSLIGLLIRRRQNANGENEINANSFHSGVPVERVFYSPSESTKTVTDGNKTEELILHNEDLRKHVQQLLKEVEDVKKENTVLKDKLENTNTIFSDIGGSELELIPDLPPLEMPQFDFDLFELENKKSEEDSEHFLGKSPL